MTKRETIGDSVTIASSVTRYKRLSASQAATPYSRLSMHSSSILSDVIFLIKILIVLMVLRVARAMRMSKQSIAMAAAMWRWLQRWYIANVIAIMLLRCGVCVLYRSFLFCLFVWASLSYRWNRWRSYSFTHIRSFNRIDDRFNLPNQDWTIDRKGEGAMMQ